MRDEREKIGAKGDTSEDDYSFFSLLSVPLNRSSLCGSIIKTCSGFDILTGRPRQTFRRPSHGVVGVLPPPPPPPFSAEAPDGDRCVGFRVLTSRSAASLVAIARSVTSCVSFRVVSFPKIPLDWFWFAARTQYACVTANIIRGAEAALRHAAVGNAAPSACSCTFCIYFYSSFTVPRNRENDGSFIFTPLGLK